MSQLVVFVIRETVPVGLATSLCEGPQESGGGEEWLVLVWERSPRFVAEPDGLSVLGSTSKRGPSILTAPATVGGACRPLGTPLLVSDQICGNCSG